MSLAKSHKDANNKIYYPNVHNARDYNNWIRKVSNNLDSKKYKSGVPLSYVICATNANPNKAVDDYYHALWAVSFDTPQYRGDDNHWEVYHLFRDLLTKTEQHGSKRSQMEMGKLSTYCCMSITLVKHMIQEAQHPQMKSSTCYPGRVIPVWEVASNLPISRRALRNGTMLDNRFIRSKRVKCYFAASSVMIYRCKQWWALYVTDTWTMLTVVVPHFHEQFLATLPPSNLVAGYALLQWQHLTLM